MQNTSIFSSSGPLGHTVYEPMVKIWPKQYWTHIVHCVWSNALHHQKVIEHGRPGVLSTILCVFGAMNQHGWTKIGK